MNINDVLQRNLSDVRQRMAAACKRVSRAPDAVTLVAVTKYAELDWVRALVELGQRHLAENRPQQLAQRAAQLPDEVHWHLIGHLQRNKVELVLPIAELIHSVDSLRLLDALEQQALKRGVTCRVLLEVNVSGEPSKDGFNPADLRDAVTQIAAYERVHIEGLMTMAPQAEDPEVARPWFKALRDLRNELTTLSDGRLNIPHLSMGMSGDFEVAIEEGATLIRVGSSLFAGCEKPL